MSRKNQYKMNIYHFQSLQLAQAESAAIRGQAAWMWLDARLDRFTPWHGNELSLPGVQTLAELSLIFIYLTNFTKSWSKVCVDPQAESRWQRYIIEQLTLPAFAELPRKRPAQASAYILPYLMMRSSGWRHPYYEKTLDLLTAWGFPDSVETVPFRKLDAAYFLNISGYGAAQALIPFYERTFLAHMKSFVYINDNAVYSITHTLLYLSNFGNAEIELPDEQLVRIRMVVESLIVHYWRLCNWDLLGELLLCAAIVGSPQRSLAQYALAAFFAAHEKDGSISYSSDMAASEVADARMKGDESKLFGLCYHTTLVSLLLSAQLLARQS